MKQLLWKDSYSVGDHTIDNQHRELIRIANELIKIKSHAKKASEFRDILIKLVKYVKVHFAYEEEYMQKHKYPHLEKHKLEHEKIIDKLNDIVKNSKTVHDLDLNLSTLLNEWIIDHILKKDKAYYKTIHSKNYKALEIV